MKRGYVILLFLIISFSFVNAQELITEEDLPSPQIFSNDSTFQKITYQENEKTFIVYMLKFHSESLLKEKINYTLDEVDKELTINHNGSFISIYKNYIEWISSEKIIHIEGSDSKEIIKSNLFLNYLNKFPSNTNDYTKKSLNSEFSTNFVILTSKCETCGEGWFNLCDQQECWDLGSTCYSNFLLITTCHNGSLLSNGDDAFCNYKGQRKGGCLRNEFDCDSDSQCSGNLDCVDFDGGICLLGLECGCCNFGEYWNTNLNKCYVQLDHGEYDCNFNSDCKSDLVCDGNTPLTDFENEGCCYDYENWNAKNLFCNYAVKGKVYEVNQNNQSSTEDAYENLKLRVFIKQDYFGGFDLGLLTGTLGYFDVNTNSNGEFKFNPEKFVGNIWNWDDIIVSFKIQKILAIENNEIIGGWSNQFSNEEAYQIGNDSVDQFVRIHKNKNSWKKQEIPNTQKGLLTKSLEETPSNPQEVILKWNGTFIAEKEGDYNFQFNVTGNVLFQIDNDTLINLERNIGNNKIKIYLKEGKHTVYFKFNENITHYPQIFWSFENNKLEKISEKNWIKTWSKLFFHPEIEKIFKTSSSDIVNNQPDYMISFLEKPMTIRNTNPLVFVHGKHGESGYWNGNSQDYFNDLGYDTWEFYYSGDDYINVSGALLGDALDYLKRNNYGQNKKFDIITHSMGGLVARSYIQNISPYLYKNDVDHLVMIGPPNYGSSGSTGIVSDWQFGFVDTILSSAICLSPISGYRDFEESCWFRGYNPNDPIYQQMSFGSALILSLSNSPVQNVKTFVISGNQDKCFKVLGFYVNDNGILMESDNGEDCLVAHSSSNLLDKNITSAIVSGKSHVTELDEITDYSKLILDFLQDQPDSILAFDPLAHAYYNPKTGFKKNFDQYKEGSVQIKLLEDGKIWNEFSTSDLIIEEIATGRKFNLTRNIQSKNYFHFNRQSGKIDSFYTFPAGAYRLIVPEYADSNKLHFLVKPMETNFLEINLSKCIPSSEICDGKDNNCNNLIDENIPNVSNGSNVGTCKPEIKSCINGSFKIIQNKINPIDEICKDGLDNNCDGEIDDKGECFINIISPKNIFYSEDRIPFKIETESIVDEISFIDWNDRRPKDKILCRECDSFGIDKRKLISFDEGLHNISIKAQINESLTEEKSIQFLVDSTIPKITKLEPRRGLSNGIFKIEFREENPKDLKLFYVNGNKNVSIDVDKCIVDEDEYTCEMEINLSNYYKQEINYWLEIKDIADNRATSRINKIKIDTTSPFVNVFNYSINKRKVKFYFNVTEENFDEIMYIDTMDRRPRDKNLCSNLKKGICESSESFKSGAHNLTIKILDKAGNSKEISVLFTIF